jgi:hypothetical protein
MSMVGDSAELTDTPQCRWAVPGDARLARDSAIRKGCYAATSSSTIGCSRGLKDRQ